MISWMLRVFLVVIMVLISNISFSQKEKDKLQTQKRKLEKDIEKTNKLLEQTKKTALVNIEQLSILKKQITYQQLLITVIREEISGINTEINNLNKSIKKLEEELEQIRGEYAKMIYYSYLTRSSYHRLMFIFASKNINEAYRRYKYLQEYSSARQRHASNIESKQKELSDNIAQLEKIKIEKLNLLKQEESQVANLSKQRTARDKYIKDLRKQEAKLKSDINKKQKEATRLNRKIEELIRREIEEARKRAEASKVPGYMMPMTTAELEIAKGFSANKGKLPWPVEHAVVIAPFGEYPHPVLPGIKIKNNGIDIATRENTQARAIFDGVVSAIFTLPNETKAVIIRHGSYLTVYANLISVKVKKGDNVKASDFIGIIYTNLSDNNAILHFEIWEEKTHQNPELWLREK